jgi:hypothetical protein
MMRKRVATTPSAVTAGRRRNLRHWLRVGVAAASWAATVGIVEIAAQSEIGRTARQLEERIEMQLRLMERVRVTAPEQLPTERSHEESIEPWELVGV